MNVSVPIELLRAIYERADEIAKCLPAGVCGKHARKIREEVEKLIKAETPEPRTK